MGMQTLVDKQDLHGGKATSLNKFLSPFFGIGFDG
jgi:hypothetical protein